MKTPDQIQSALKNSEFYLEYMPTIKLKDDACCGAEALLRWEKEGRVVSPLEYIPTIENTSLSGTLSYWVIEEVGHEMRSWLLATDDVHIAIKYTAGDNKVGEGSDMRLKKQDLWMLLIN